MTKTAAAALVWAPRIAGILMSLFLGLFALDAFDGRPFTEALLPFAIHLAPALIVLTVVILAWRVEWIGAVAFLALAIGYAVMVKGRLDWIAVISGPLALVGVLFFLSWRHRGAGPAV